MAKHLRYAARFLTVTLTVLIVALAAFDFSAFQTRREQIDRLIASTTGDERALSKSMTALLKIAVVDHVSRDAARILIAQLKVPDLFNGNYGRLGTIALWSAFVKLHLSEREQLALLAAYSVMGEGRLGLSAEAQARFHQPLSALSLQEECVLATMVFSPYMTNAVVVSPERLARRQDWLINQYKNGT